MSERVGSPGNTDRQAGDLYQSHLQVELQRIDLRLQRAVRLWQEAGQNPNDAFRGLYISDEEADALLSRPLSTGWGHGTTLTTELEAAFRQKSADLAQAAANIASAAQEQRRLLPLVHLREAFGLSQFELDTLLIAIAPSVDLRYERLYGYLQDDVTRKRPTVNLVLDLLAEPGIGRLPLLAAFEPGAPLFRHHLLELQGPGEASHAPKAAPLLANVLHADEGLVAWLLGRYRPHTALAGHLSVHQVPPE
ncbi:MAG: hypothetical protein JXC32_12260, partial [Anaerolineae bacterium]|nr:hypothetical protein [Anaerolineae bacterium]